MFLAATLCFYSGFKCDVLTSGWEKCVSKMDLLNRPGHAVSLLRNRHFWLVLGVVGVSIGFSMVSGREAATI